MVARGKGGATYSFASVRRPSESGKENRWSYGQERTHRHNAHYRSNSEFCSGNEMRAEAISNQKIEDNHIKQTCEQTRRVGVASYSPVYVNSKHVGDESCQKDEWQDDPVTSQTVEEQVADRNQTNGPCIKPEEHPHGIGRPEIVYDPLHKPAVEKCLVKDMNDV